MIWSLVKVMLLIHLFLSFSVFNFINSISCLATCLYLDKVHPFFFTCYLCLFNGFIINPLIIINLNLWTKYIYWVYLNMKYKKYTRYFVGPQYLDIYYSLSRLICYHSSSLAHESPLSFHSHKHLFIDKFIAKYTEIKNKLKYCQYLSLKSFPETNSVSKTDLKDTFID